MAGFLNMVWIAWVAFAGGLIVRLIILGTMDWLASRNDATPRYVGRCRCAGPWGSAANCHDCNGTGHIWEA